MKLHLPELHYNLGHVLHRQHDLNGSVAAYRQAIQFDPAFAQAHHSLAVVLAEQRQYEAALFHYRRVIALQPDAVRAYNNIGCILIQQGEVEQAVELYQQAIQLSPGWAVLHNNFGKAIEAQDPVRAIAAYRQALHLQPDLGSAHHNLGQALQRQRRYTEAAECYEQRLGLEGADVIAHTGCSLAYMALAQWEQAFGHLRQAIQPQQAQIRAFCNWADQLCSQDQLTLARQACSRFLRSLLVDRLSCSDLCQDLAEVYLHLGKSLLRYGGAEQYRQAESYFQQALRLHPQQLELYLQLAECLHRQQRQNAALMVCHTALSLVKSASIKSTALAEAILHQKLGQILEQQQRWQEVITHYRQVLQIQSLHGDVFACAQFDTQEYSGTLQPLSIQSLPADSALLAPSFRKSETDQSTASRSNLVRGVYPSALAWAKSQGCKYDSLEAESNNRLEKHPALLKASIDITQKHCNSGQSIQVQGSSSSTDCKGLNCTGCLKQIADRFSLKHLGKGTYTCQGLQKVEPPPCFVVEIPRGQAWITPYRSAWMVTNSVAVLTPDDELLADVSREYPGQLPDCDQSPNFERISNAPTSTPEWIAGRVAVLSGLSGHNYFHWMVDILPRLELLKGSGVDLAEIDWFWINRPQSQFQQQTLERLGIPLAKVLSSDDYPHIQAEQLLVPSFPGHLGWLEPWALKFLRDQFLPMATPNLGYERLYISRAKAHHRRLLNEAEILDYLQPLGFVAVELEALSLADQIALFAHAKVIVAPHGGGLTNMIFCSPQATIIELFTPTYIRHYYCVISQHLQLNHYLVQGEQSECTLVHSLMYPSPLMEDIWLNRDPLEMALAQIGLGTSQSSS